MKVKDFIRNRMAFFSAVIIILIVLFSLVIPAISGFDPAGQDLSSRLCPPDSVHFFGTDELGRDVLTRLFYGTRISLLVALIPTAISVLIGMILGITGAYCGKWVDFMIMWLADVTLSVPGMLLAMVVLYSFGGSFISVFLSLVILEWGSIARIVRSSALSIQESEFITAARTMGVRSLSIILRHILPNLIPTIIVLFTLNIPTSILSESALSFLGIGIQPPGVSLGLMVNQSRQFLFDMPWLALAPAGMIMILVLAFHFLGDALRDILDPRSDI